MNQQIQLTKLFATPRLFANPRRACLVVLDLRYRVGISAVAVAVPHGCFQKLVNGSTWHFLPQVTLKRFLDSHS